MNIQEKGKKHGFRVTEMAGLRESTWDDCRHDISQNQNLKTSTVVGPFALSTNDNTSKLIPYL